MDVQQHLSLVGPGLVRPEDARNQQFRDQAVGFAAEDMGAALGDLSLHIKEDAQVVDAVAQPLLLQIQAIVAQFAGHDRDAGVGPLGEHRRYVRQVLGVVFAGFVPVLGAHLELAQVEEREDGKDHDEEQPGNVAAAEIEPDEHRRRDADGAGQQETRDLQHKGEPEHQPEGQALSPLEEVGRIAIGAQQRAAHGRGLGDGAHQGVGALRQNLKEGDQPSGAVGKGEPEAQAKEHQAPFRQTGRAIAQRQADAVEMARPPPGRMIGEQPAAGHGRAEKSDLQARAIDFRRRVADERLVPQHDGQAVHEDGLHRHQGGDGNAGPRMPQPDEHGEQGAAQNGGEADESGRVLDGHPAGEAEKRHEQNAQQGAGAGLQELRQFATGDGGGLNLMARIGAHTGISRSKNPQSRAVMARAV